MDQKSSFFICPRVSARFLHCFCTVSRDAMGTLTCKIRQGVQKLHSEKSRCFAQKRRKLETSKIRVFCPVGSFNQRARDSSSLERAKIQRRIVRFLVGFFFYTPFARSLHSFHITAGDHQLVGGRPWNTIFSNSGCSARQVRYHLSQFSKIVPIKNGILRYAVCGCCLCIKSANYYSISCFFDSPS